jgi:hypothetical protein
LFSAAFPLLLLASVQGARGDEFGTKVIASLAGREFRAKDLSVNDAKVRKQLHASLGREPKAEELTEALKTKQIEQLVDWVYQGILSEGAAQYGISVSEEDQRAKLAEIYKNDAAVLDKLTGIRERLPDAWREARANPDRASQIYEERLKDLMSRDRWQKYLAEDTTAETIRRLEAMAPPKKEDLYRPSDSLKRVLVERALRDRVVKGITATDDELLSEYRGMGYEKPFEEVKDTVSATVVANKREQAWQQWLRKRMKDATSSIHDDELRKRYEAYLQEAKDRGRDASR